MYTTNGLAKILGLSERRIRQWAKSSGKQKMGVQYLFTQADIDAINATRGKVGPRPGNAREKNATNK